MPLTDQRQRRRRDTKQGRRARSAWRLLRWRVGLHWYLFVLFGPPWASCSRRSFARRGTARGARAELGLALHVFLPGVVVPFLHTNLWEELGGTGFLQSTLQDRRGSLPASLIVVPFFALFHDGAVRLPIKHLLRRRGRTC
jgi:membrane protease YdiL (CAAX protease family)